jgi:hypothetical protein
MARGQNIMKVRLSVNVRLRVIGIALLGLVMVATSSTATAQEVVLARITVPGKSQTVRGNITIQGTASAPALLRYQVDFSIEPDLANWTLINADVKPVSNGVLAVWNTRPLPDGIYAIRVQVFTSDGLAAETFVRELKLANATTTTNSDTTKEISATSSITTTAANSTVDDPTGINLDLAALPQAFIRGARYALIAFGVLAAYLILKKILSAILHRIDRKHIDYGR